MPFHRNAAGAARFGPKRPAGPGAKPAQKAPAPKSEHEKIHGAAQAPHGGEHSQEKHVAETHPGKTKPHPETGVHAFHAHHTGEHASGGPAYSTHTHHDDGSVETKDNQSHEEMLDAQNQAFPAPNEEDAMGEPAAEDDVRDVIGEGIGGAESV